MQAALIGLAQSFALFPGISRSGVTMVAGMSIGLSHESAARFSFLLATPIILAAGLLEIPKLFGEGTQILVLALIGGVIAGVAAYSRCASSCATSRRNRSTPLPTTAWARACWRSASSWPNTSACSPESLWRGIACAKMDAGC